MLRASLLIALGWVLAAGIAGLGHAFGLTLALPATSVILVCHLAFERERGVPAALAMAIILGYLEDLHQGMPTGVLALAYALVFLALRWLGARLAVAGQLVRGLTALIACAAADLLTWAILAALSGPLEISRDALAGGLRMIHWHALATMLAAPAVWGMIARLDALITRMGGVGARSATPPKPQLTWKRP